MFLPAQDIAQRCAKPKQQHGYWIACCPAHNDRSPSLAIKDAGDRTLLKCFAGCETSAILAALGLSWPQLFRDRRDSGQSWYPPASAHLKVLAQPPVLPKPKRKTKRGRLLAEYQYRSADGQHMFSKLRYELLDAETGEAVGKDFSQRNARTGAWNLKGVSPIPYRLPEFIHEHHVHIVEGEKDANSLWEIGIPATCCPGGAGAWPKTRDFNRWFTAMGITVWHDNDEPGRNHARLVDQCLKPFAEEIQHAYLPPDLPKGADITDWITSLAGATQ